MSLSHRFVVRAAFLLVILAIGGGCAAKPAPVEPARSTDAGAPTTVLESATGIPSPRPTETAPAAAAPSPAPSPTVPGESQPPADGSPPVEPRFGPAWGERSIYERGLVASEHGVLDQLPGASEYRIDLAIDDSLTRVSGEQQVRFTNREDAPLADVYLRLFPNALGGKMRVSGVTVDGAGVTPEYQYEDTAIRVALPAPLGVGESVVLGLKYEIEVPDTLDTGYGLLSYTNNTLALDTPYAAIPVYDDEGWNVETPPKNADTSFNDASFYLVRVTAPEELALVTTGVEVAREEAGDKQIVTYAQGPARDFFVAGSPEYIVTSEQVGETKINAFAKPGEEKAMAVALDAAAKALRVFSERFGPFPYTELDVAATPMLALGIEYPGAVGISERVYDPQYAPEGTSAATILESTVGHELAHQWFYNLVGNDQIDEPWLDEALAQYSTWLYFTDVYGEQAGNAFRESWGSRWDRTDREMKPVGLPAEEYSDREYSSIVYGRGPLFLAELAERMGQDRFHQFLKDYSARFRWGIATAEEFKALAEEACGCDLGDVYKEWLEPGQG